MDIFKDKGSHTQGGTKHINKPTPPKGERKQEPTKRKRYAKDNNQPETKERAGYISI